MTRLLLVRHGHVAGITPPRFRGREEIPLTAVGREQAKLTGQRVASSYRVDAIYASPLGRSMATGEAIALATGAPVESEANLSDLDYGDWTGRSHEDVAAEHPELSERWWSRPWLFRFPGGEALQDVVARTADAARGIFGRHADGTVVMVGHDSSIRALLINLLDLPFSAYRTFSLAPCSITEIDAAASRISAISVNETNHLDGASIVGQAAADGDHLRGK